MSLFKRNTVYSKGVLHFRKEYFYHEKYVTLEFLRPNNYFKLKIYSTSNHSEIIKMVLKIIHTDLNKLILPNPLNPKIHTIRSVVSFLSTPSYNVSNLLIIVIKANNIFNNIFKSFL